MILFNIISINNISIINKMSPQVHFLYMNMSYDKININNKIYNVNNKIGAIIGHFLGINHYSKLFTYNLINLFESQSHYL